MFLAHGRWLLFARAVLLCKLKKESLSLGGQVGRWNRAGFQTSFFSLAGALVWCTSKTCIIVYGSSAYATIINWPLFQCLWSWHMSSTFPLENNTDLCMKLSWYFPWCSSPFPNYKHYFIKRSTVQVTTKVSSMFQLDRKINEIQGVVNINNFISAGVIKSGLHLLKIVFLTWWVVTCHPNDWLQSRLKLKHIHIYGKRGYQLGGS